MSHIDKLIFNRFRIFESEFEMDLKPITFLTGPNSSGKSSILKSILLLKSNFSSNLQVLDFTGEKHNLGTFEKTINKNSKKEDTFSIGFQSQLHSGSPFGGLFKESFTTRRSVFHVLREVNDGDTTSLLITLHYRRVERSGKLHRIEINEKDSDKPFLILSIAKDESDTHTLDINPKALKDNDYLNNLFLNFRISKERKKITNFKSSISVLKKYSIPSKFTIQDGVKEAFYDEPILVFSQLFRLFLEENFKSSLNKELPDYFMKQPLKQILQDFSSILENTEYIEAVRANTKRLYTNDSQGTGFNDLILDYNSRDIEPSSLRFINKWLVKFEIAEEIIFKNVEGVATTIYLKNKDEETALADLGYGITQFLPILLKIALEQPIKKSKGYGNIVKKLILVEEPETNLHPKLQSLLADFFVDALASFEIRFIIETHSEYLIRKMQILIGDKDIISSDSNIYYFNSNWDNEVEKVIKINFLENGALDNEFGKGFYDEATNLKFELLKRKAIK